MVFSGLVFLFRFLPCFFIVYYLTPEKRKNLILFLGSLIFYAWGEPVYVLLMLFSTVSDYIHGIWIERYRLQGKIKYSRRILISAISINLILLITFKVPLLNLPLPLGISFYTFQTMSYSIDVYKGKVRAQKSLLDFGVYVTLFPQLVAGPIVTYNSICGELKCRSRDAKMLWQGLRRFIIGLGKKVLMANQIGMLFEALAGSEQISVLSAWLTAVSFGLQIYFDFSGYSDMAIGLGRMLGFHFPENFCYPYTAGSITEFWRRWHISLGSWFREYVYIPLGGSRRGKGKQMRNILLVWILTGVWHGAEWNFLLWGLWFAFWLLLEKALGHRFWKLPGLIRHSYTLWVTAVSWLMFAFTDWEQLALYLGAVTGCGNLPFCTGQVLYEWKNFSRLFPILIVGATPLPAKIVKNVNRLKEKTGDKGRQIGFMLEVLFCLAVLTGSVALIVDASYNPFLYFRF